VFPPVPVNFNYNLRGFLSCKKKPAQRRFSILLFFIFLFLKKLSPFYRQLETIDDGIHLSAIVDRIDYRPIPNVHPLYLCSMIQPETLLSGVS
jgi:hypothetical protein